jgi:hypothetical protein
LTSSYISSSAEALVIATGEDGKNKALVKYKTLALTDHMEQGSGEVSGLGAS